MNDRIERVRKLLNNLNLGTQKEQVGDLFAELLAEVEDLKTRVEALETAAAA